MGRLPDGRTTAEIVVAHQQHTTEHTNTHRDSTTRAIFSLRLSRRLDTCNFALSCAHNRGEMGGINRGKKNAAARYNPAYTHTHTHAQHTMHLSHESHCNRSTNPLGVRCRCPGGGFADTLLFPQARPMYFHDDGFTNRRDTALRLPSGCGGGSFDAYLFPAPGYTLFLGLFLRFSSSLPPTRVDTFVGRSFETPFTNRNDNETG